MKKHEKKAANAAIQNFAQGIEAGVYLGQNIVAEKVVDVLVHGLALFDLGLTRYGVALIAELAEEVSEIMMQGQVQAQAPSPGDDRPKEPCDDCEKCADRNTCAALKEVVTAP